MKLMGNPKDTMIILYMKLKEVRWKHCMIIHRALEGKMLAFCDYTRSFQGEAGSSYQEAWDMIL